MYAQHGKRSKQRDRDGDTDEIAKGANVKWRRLMDGWMDGCGAWNDLGQQMAG